MSEIKNNIKDLEKFDTVEVLEEEYIVEKILDKKKTNGIMKYKVKWEGYSENECTWEPRENLSNVKYLIEEYENSIKPKEKIKEKIIKIKPEKEKKLLNNKTNRNNNNSSIKDDDENSKSVNNNSERRTDNVASILHKQCKFNLILFY